MAKFIITTVASVILGGGIGYGLLCYVSPDESEIAKHIRSNEPQNLFKLYKKKPEELKESNDIHSEIYKLQKNTSGK